MFRAYSMLFILTQRHSHALNCIWGIFNAFKFKVCDRSKINPWTIALGKLLNFLHQLPYGVNSNFSTITIIWCKQNYSCLKKTKSVLRVSAACQFPQAIFNLWLLILFKSQTMGSHFLWSIASQQLTSLHRFEASCLNSLYDKGIMLTLKTLSLAFKDFNLDFSFAMNFFKSFGCSGHDTTILFFHQHSQSCQCIFSIWKMKDLCCSIPATCHQFSWSALKNCNIMSYYSQVQNIFALKVK